MGCRRIKRFWKGPCHGNNNSFCNLGCYSLNKEGDRKLDDVKKALVVGYAIQGFIVFVLLLNMLRIISLNISTWFIPIIYISNAIVCSKIFFKQFKIKLKEVSLDIYEDLFGDPFAYDHGIKLIMFAFDVKDEDSDCIKEMKLYLKLSYLLVFVILFINAPIAIVFVF